MTNKTIVNGIDVSKCKYIDIENFEKPICHCITQRNECERPCEDNKDCYFKQLAQAKDKIGYMEEYIKIVEKARDDLEQEVEKWKHQAELGSDTTDRLSKELEDKNQEIENLKNQNYMLSKNNSVQQWCDMYNKKDKECYDALLKLAKKEQECEELKETIDDFITDNNLLYSDDGKQPSNLDELQECMQSSMNEFFKYKQVLDEVKEYCNKYSINSIGFKQSILDIISKTEEQ